MFKLNVLTQITYFCLHDDKGIWNSWTIAVADFCFIFLLKASEILSLISIHIHGEPHSQYKFSTLNLTVKFWISSNCHLWKLPWGERIIFSLSIGSPIPLWCKKSCFEKIYMPAWLGVALSICLAVFSLRSSCSSYHSLPLLICPASDKSFYCEILLSTTRKTINPAMHLLNLLVGMVPSKGSDRFRWT